MQTLLQKLDPKPCAQLPFTIGQVVYLHDNAFELIVRGFHFQSNTWFVEVDCPAAEKPGATWKFPVYELHAGDPLTNAVTKVYETRNRQFIGLIEGGKQ